MAFAATLGAFTDELVEIVTSVSAQSDPERFDVLKDSALRGIRSHNFLRTNHFQVRNELDGLEERFRIFNRDALADALRRRLDTLAQFSNKWNPEMLHFLLQLSDQPTQKSKLRDLELLKVPDEDPEPPLTWEDVAKEDGWDQDRDLWKSVDFADDSSDGGYVDTKSDASVEKSQDTSLSSVEERYRRQPTDYLATIRNEDQKLKTVQETQSWRYQSLPRNGNGRSQKTPVSELQAVREVFFMLRGLDSTLFNEQSAPCTKYNLDHASWEVYHNILGALGKARRQLAILRRFAKQHQNIPLIQVFQDAIEKRVLTFDRELSKMEAQFVDIKQDVLVQEPSLQFENSSAFGPGSFMPFSEIFNETFENWMQSKHHAAASTLRQALFESYNLWSVLDDLRHVYLMCNGSQSDALAFSIFGNIDLLNSKWHDRFGLTEVAREAHNTVLDADRIAVTVTEEHRESVVHEVRRTVRKGLPGVTISYHLPWPIQIVLSNESLEHYQAVFTLLLQLRRAHYMTHKHRLKTDGVAETSHDQATFYRLRSKLIWFCSSLQSYLTTLVIGPLMTELRESLQQAADIDDLAAVHSTIMRRMIDEACLGSKLDLIHQCILDILDLTIRLEDARQQEYERAEEMKEISRLSMISSPRKSRRGRYVHPSEEEDESFLAEQDRSVLIQDAEKTYADVLVEIGAELDRHLKFMCGGLRGAARASGKDAAVKWDTLAEMLEVGVVQDRGRFNTQLYA
ncbi:hypothetical protein DL766_008682 [Monosporascus sp. MC13-8B]|uniref:Spindle pole body component n=1 Tax=Monosporascus cannonballus TaxID=155416 RepID=A0ABY0H4L6_9PEZI|nr:hypothetical protein DL762_005559 [Monosporascus cannonballus]RYO89540.1 hypothetical protein DL763_005640 [Monosporascus cannonballus]RYP18411.1 hypothetical protein DL766_008682 [Monosporascus sp. MC13-8B]